MPTLYRDLFLKSLRLTLRTPWLWFYGILLSPIINGGVVEILVKSVSLPPAGSPAPLLFLEELQDFAVVRSIHQIVDAIWIQNRVGFPTYLLLALIAVLVAFVVWLMIVSIGGMISSARKLFRNEKTSLKESFTDGERAAPNVALVTIGTMVLLVALFSIMRGLLSIEFGSPVLSITVFSLSFTIVALAAAILYFIGFYASTFIVTKKLAIADALRNALRLTLQHWLILVELTTILFLVFLAVALAVLYLDYYFVAVPLATIFASLVSAGWMTLENATMITEAAYYIVMVLVLGILSTYQALVWIFLFMHYTSAKTRLRSKLQRMSDAIAELRARPYHPTNN